MSSLTLEEAVEQLINDDFDMAAVATVINSSASDIVSITETHGEEADYQIEKAIESISEPEAASLVPRIKSYWLSLKDLDGASEPFEIKIRCAELLARVNLSNKMSNDEIEKLSKSKDWTDRLVAGNMVSQLQTEFGQSIREALAEDNFQDDNGFFLVREAVGVESE
jgi:hypothetical protein